MDKKKKAANIMAKAFEAEGMELIHLIGPKTGHKYEPQAKEELDRRIDELAKRGRNPVPSQVKFATFTLRYNRMLWVVVDGLDEHWKQARVEAEMGHAVAHWRRQFRGEAMVKADSEITDADIASSNLVLWGDPSSNAILAKIIDKLPLKWNADSVTANGEMFASDHHVPAMIYPNPLNPKKYVVLNSGFTFREYDYLNNARQVPKLPDWAVIDVSQPVTGQKPGGIPAAGFFNEEWKFSK